MIKNSTPIFLLMLLLLTSCGSYKDIPYYQDLGKAQDSVASVANFKKLTIKPGDILAINVSTRSPESSQIFNNNLNRINGNVYDTSAENPLTGFRVDANNVIHLPILDTVQTKGLSTMELEAKIALKMKPLYKDVVINVRFVNLRVAIYGDVAKPNTYTLPNERTTITQALAMAGDLNITAKRKGILLVREVEGKRHFIPIDLTSKKIFESDYYYLQNNDEIYVQPDRTKYATVDKGYRIATLVLSGLSIIAIVLSNLYR